jgi:hypothetical protein
MEHMCALSNSRFISSLRQIDVKTLLEFFSPPFLTHNKGHISPVTAIQEAFTLSFIKENLQADLMGTCECSQPISFQINSKTPHSGLNVVSTKPLLPINFIRFLYMLHHARSSIERES